MNKNIKKIELNQKNETKRQKLKKLKTGQEGHLSDLIVGQKGTVLALHNDNLPLRRRLLDMGITKGVEIRIKKIAPLGDPIDIELRGYELCLRKNDMKNIDIKVVD